MLRLLRLYFSFLLLTTSALAADLQVKVVDPHGAVVSGARVTAYPPNSTAPASVLQTRADGTAQLTGVAEGTYRIRILAAGFAPAETSVTTGTEIATVRLSVATAAETVVVSAERMPLPAQESGADTTLLDAQAITSMQSVAASEALRFLPGAVVSASGRRGSLASLFVRGGESR
jgi:hypothetical protein